MGTCMIGDRGRAASPLRPTGVVEVGGSRRDARAAPGPGGGIDPGADVVVVGWDVFGLVVRPSADVPDPRTVANAGEAVPTPDDLARRRDAADREARQEERQDALDQAREVAALVAVVGAVAAGVGYAIADGVGAAVGAGVFVAVMIGLCAKYALGAGGGG